MAFNKLGDTVTVLAQIEAWKKQRAEMNMPLTPASLRVALGIEKDTLIKYGKQIAYKDEDERIRIDAIKEALNACGASMEDFYGSPGVKHDLFGSKHLQATHEWDNQPDQQVTVTFVGVDDVPD